MRREIMTTFKGRDWVLKFTCGDCGTVDITVDPASEEDMLKLGKWLLTHSADGGKYENVYRRHNSKALAALIEMGWELKNSGRDGELLVKAGVAIKADAIRNYG
jgi:hypothetical protein